MVVFTSLNLHNLFMIYVRLKGGLGNQMFQYAFGQSLQAKTGINVLYDTTFLEQLLNQKSHNKEFTPRYMNLDIFPNINTKTITSLPFFKTFFSSGLLSTIERKLREKTTPHFIAEKRYRYDLYDMKAKNGAYFDGNWQSYKYFENIKEQITAAFSFKDANAYNVANTEAILFEEKIKQSGYSAVCIHVRRGDMAHNERAHAHHGTAPVEYYKSAIKIITEKVSNPIFFVFSDDIAWCKSIFTDSLFGEEEKKNNSTLGDISYNFFNEAWSGTKAANTMRLMTYCAHFIIGNSTFAWWGAYLGEARQHKSSDSKQDSLIVAPKKFFKAEGYDATDLISSHWITIDTPLD